MQDSETSRQCCQCRHSTSKWERAILKDNLAQSEREWELWYCREHSVNIMGGSSKEGVNNHLNIFNLCQLYNPWCFLPVSRVIPSIFLSFPLSAFLIFLSRYFVRHQVSEPHVCQDWRASLTVHLSPQGEFQVHDISIFAKSPPSLPILCLISFSWSGFTQIFRPLCIPLLFCSQLLFVVLPADDWTLQYEPH